MLVRLVEIWRATTPEIINSYGRVVSELERYAARPKDFRPLNFRVKQAVRTLFVTAEAMSGAMSDCLIHLHWMVGAEIPEHVISRLKEAERRNLRSSSDRRYIRLGTDERTKLALKYFPRLYGVSSEPRLLTEWQQFKELLKIRNGFTHPGTALDLLGARALPNLLPAAIWLIEQFSWVIVECGRAIGIRIPGEVVTGGAAGLPKWSTEIKTEPEKLFNRDFDAQVAASPSSSIALLRFYLDITHYEFTRVVDDLRRLERRGRRNRLDTRIAVRDFVQTVSASGEATLGFLGFFLRSARKRCEVLVRRRGLERLARGDDVASRLVEAVDLFSRKVGSGARVNQDKGLSDYRATLDVRDRLTHPRGASDLVVSEEELDRTKLAWCWLADVRGLLEIRPNYSILDRLRFWERWTL